MEKTTKQSLQADIDQLVAADWEHDSLPSKKTLVGLLNAVLIGLKSGRIPTTPRSRMMIARCLGEAVSASITAHAGSVQEFPIEILDAIRDVAEKGELDIDLRWSSARGVTPRSFPVAPARPNLPGGAA